MIIIATSTALIAQENEFIKTKSGLEYKITTKGNGEYPQKGDLIKVHYRGTLLDGTEFDSSFKRGKPFEFGLGMGQVIKGWDEGFTLLSKGAKAILKLPADIAYGSRAMGKIPANSDLIFEVELLDFTRIEQYDFTGKERIEDESGLVYYIIEEGEGEHPKVGETVSVHYSGYLEDGTMFDSSVQRGRPFSFQLGMGRVIKGWDTGIQLMRPNAKYRLEIPPELGYGKRAMGPIPANATLIFDVELQK